MYNPGFLFFPSGNMRPGNVSVLLATKCYYVQPLSLAENELLAYTCLPVGKDKGDSIPDGVS